MFWHSIVIALLSSQVMSYEQKDEEFMKDNKCDQLFRLTLDQDNRKIFVLKLNSIKPYTEQRKLCFILTQNNQPQITNNTITTSHQAINQTIDNKSQFLESSPLKHDQLYFLRIDSMPNQCISVKNDVKFNFIDHLNAFYDKNKKTWIAEVVVRKQCANINSKLSNDKYQQSVDLIVQVRKTIINIFGFPLYQQPFTDLGVTLLIVVISFVLIQFLLLKLTKKID